MGLKARLYASYIKDYISLGLQPPKHYIRTVNNFRAGNEKVRGELITKRQILLDIYENNLASMN